MLDFITTFAVADALKGGDLNKIYQSLQSDWLYTDATRNVTFLDNHDMSRFYSVIGEDFAKYKMGLAWLLTLRGIPQIYYGTEVLMKNFSDPDGKVREDFPGGWPGDKLNYFRARPGQAGAAFDYVSKLANYRKTHPVLSERQAHAVHPAGWNLYAYFRYNEADCVMVIANNTDQEKTVDGTRFAERTSGFTAGVEVVSGVGVSDLQRLTVPARTVWVVELRK